MLSAAPGELAARKIWEQRNSGPPLKEEQQVGKVKSFNKTWGARKILHKLSDTVHRTERQVKRSLENFLFSKEDNAFFAQSNEVSVSHRKCLTKAGLIAAIQAAHAEDHYQSDMIYETLRGCCFPVVRETVAFLSKDGVKCDLCRHPCRRPR